MGADASNFTRLYGRTVWLRNLGRCEAECASWRAGIANIGEVIEIPGFLLIVLALSSSGYFMVRVSMKQKTSEDNEH